MIRRMLFAVLAMIGFGALMPLAAVAQSAYPPDNPVGLVIEPAVCTNNSLIGFVHGAVAGSTVTILLAYPDATLNATLNVTADATGRADFNTQIPVPRPTGVNVTATGTTATGTFTAGAFSLTSSVSFADCGTTPTTTPPTTKIPPTGSNVGPGLRFAGIAVGVGALLLVVARRRRHAPASGATVTN